MLAARGPSSRTALGVGAGEHVDDVADAEALADAGDAGEDLLRDDGRVVDALDLAAGRRRRRRSRRARRPGRSTRRVRVAAARRRAEACMRPEQLARVRRSDLRRALLRRRRAGARRSESQRMHVGGGVEQHALGLQAVAAGAAGLLLVVLDRLRHGGVDDAAHVAAVDAHAEGDGGDDDVELLGREGVLGCAGARRRPCRRGRAPRGSAAFAQVRAPARSASLRRDAVDDAGLARRGGAIDRQHLRAQRRRAARRGR